MDNFVRRRCLNQFPTLSNFKKSTEKFLKYGLTDRDCYDGIETACEFFGIPMPQIINDFTENPIGHTMMVSSCPTSYWDDIICYNLEELVEMGANNKNSFSLIMTHECAHRILQNTPLPGLNNGRWENELICDYFMGVRAGVEGLPVADLNAIKNAIYNSPGAMSHPIGPLRYEVISYGYTNVGCFDLIHHRKRTLQEYMLNFEKWRNKNEGLIRQSQIPFYGY